MYCQTTIMQVYEVLLYYTDATAISTLSVRYLIANRGRRLNIYNTAK